MPDCFAVHHEADASLAAVPRYDAEGGSYGRLS